MLRILQSWCVGLVMLSASGALLAQTDRATAEQLVRKSGLWEQLASLSPQVQDAFSAALERGGKPTSDAERQRLAGVLADAYAPQRLQAAAVGTVSRRLGAAHVPVLKRWYDSATGRQVTRLEEAASADPAEPDVVVREGVAVLERASPARRALLEKLLKETRAAEALVQIAINSSLAIHRGVTSMQAEAPAMSSKELRALMEAQRPEMLQGFSGMMLAGFARTYEPLPDEVLQQYVAFVGSKSGAHFNAVAIEALDAALTEAAAAMGRGLPGTKDGVNT